VAVNRRMGRMKVICKPSTAKEWRVWFKACLFMSGVKVIA